MHPMLKGFFVSINLVLYVATAVCQETTTKLAQPVSMEINGLLGFFIANQPKSLYLRDDHSKLIELNVSLQTRGNHQWQYDNRFPRIGIGILHGTTGSNQYLGKLTALYSFLHFPLIRTAKTQTTFRLGAGAGWIQKPYDKVVNHKNLMIGTHLNACISLRLQSEWKLSQKLYANLGLAFTHLSNGSIKLPNLGLNIPAATIGIRHALTDAPLPAENKLRKAEKKTTYYIHVSGALKQTYPLESSIHLVKIANFELLRTISATGRVGTGVIISYDRSLSNEIANAPTYIFDKSELQVQGSVYGSYEQVVGRLSFPLQFGVYLYNKYMVSRVFQMIGIRYCISDRFMVNMQLKTHFGKADYIQYGIGYTL
jgi:hypothetical protein